MSGDRDTTDTPPSTTDPVAGGGSPQHDDAPETGADLRVPNDAPETGRTYGESVDAAAAAAASGKASGSGAASGSGSASSSAAASGSAAAAPVRPERPAFGEYATPEEQRAAIRVPFDTEEGVPVVADADAPVAPVDHDGHAVSSPASYGERVAGAQRPTPQPTGQDAPSGVSGSSKPSRASGRGGSGAESGGGSNSGTGNGSGTGTRSGSGSGSANGKQTPGGFFANAFGGGSSAAAAADSSADGVAPARRDRLITYLLLAFGLLAVLNSVSGISALPVSVKQAFEQMNVTATPPTDLLITLGWITAGIHALMWVVALLWSLSAVRRGKLSWWIPVLCGVIFVVVATVVIFAGFATDPTIMDAVMQRG